jgi:hypothetical protein
MCVNEPVTKEVSCRSLHEHHFRHTLFENTSQYVPDYLMACMMAARSEHICYHLKLC